jgi:predicted GNAT family acetyltransferase
VTRTSGLAVKRLGPGQANELEAFLRSDPIAYVYPLGWLLRDGIIPRVHYLDFIFLGVYRARELVGAGMLAGGVLLFVATHDEEAAAALGSSRLLRPNAFRVIVGPLRSVDLTWAALRERGYTARLERPQIVYTVTPATLVRLEEPRLRRAVRDDLERVLEATIDMHEHETLERPRPADIEGFRRSVEYQIRLGRIWVLLDRADGQIRFKAAVSVQCDVGTQIEGVYVPPGYRRKGFAQRCLSELCQRLLRHAPLVSLYVNADNQPAIRLYEEGLGFERALDYKTVFLSR